jgi:hypothetical protein
MIPNFGVECEHCQEAVLTPIPREWADLEPAVIQSKLLEGLDVEAAEEIHDFYLEHLDHGARPCVCELEDTDDS